jgi:anti-sigma B factor antagonist
MPVMDLKLAVQDHGDHATIKVGGEIDLATSPQLRVVLVDLVDRGLHQLIVDLEQVSFLDCAGIGMLIDARRRVQVHGGSLKLVGPTPFVRRVLALTAMTAVFPIDTALGEAWGTEPTGPAFSQVTRER